MIPNRVKSGLDWLSVQQNLFDILISLNIIADSYSVMDGKYKKIQDSLEDFIYEQLQCKACPQNYWISILRILMTLVLLVDCHKNCISMNQLPVQTISPTRTNFAQQIKQKCMYTTSKLWWLAQWQECQLKQKVSQFDSQLENLCDITNDSTYPTHRKYSSALHFFASWSWSS